MRNIDTIFWKAHLSTLSRLRQMVTLKMLTPTPSWLKKSGVTRCGGRLTKNGALQRAVRQSPQVRQGAMVCQCQLRRRCNQVRENVLLPWSPWFTRSRLLISLHLKLDLFHASLPAMPILKCINWTRKTKRLSNIIKSSIKNVVIVPSLERKEDIKVLFDPYKPLVNPWSWKFKTLWYLW